MSDIDIAALLELRALLQLIPTNWRGARMPDVSSFDDMLAQMREKWVCGPDASTTDFRFVLGESPDPVSVVLVGNGPLRNEITSFLVRAYEAMPALLDAAEERDRLRSQRDALLAALEPIVWQLESAQRSTAPAFFKGFQMNDTESSTLLRAIAAAKETP